MRAQLNAEVDYARLYAIAQARLDARDDADNARAIDASALRAKLDEAERAREAAEAERARVALQRHAKAVVELDRLERAREAGYAVRLLELPRLGATYPKRELLLGAPRGSRAAEAIAALRTLPSPVG